MQTKSTPLVCSGHTRPVPSVAFSGLQPDGSSLMISSCKDGKAMLRDGSTGDWLGTFLGHKGAIWAAKLDLDGGRGVTGSADFTAKVWDTFTGSELATLSHNHIVRSVDISPSGSHIVTGGQEKKLRLYDIERSEAEPFLFASDNGGGQVTSSGVAHDGTIKSVVWDDERDQIVSAGEDKMVRWWDMRSLKCVHTIALSDPITSMDHSYSSPLISLTAGKQVTFLDPASRQPVITHTLDYIPSSASLHPALRDRFVTGSTQDGWVRVHTAGNGSEREVYKGHHGPVHCICYSPDGELYASGSEDGTLRLWQTAPKTFGLWRYESNGNLNSNHGSIQTS